MAIRITEERERQIRGTAAMLGASVIPGEKRNWWVIAVAGKEIGEIRYHPRARLWLATTWKEQTLGNLLGCLHFVISRN